MTERTLRPLISRVDSGKSGFSLVEIIVAIGLMTLGLAFIVPAMGFNVKANTVARYQGQANYIAERHIEKIMSWTPYENQGSQPGITSTNVLLFGSLPNTYSDDGHVIFQTEASLFHNGYTSPSNCNGIRFASSGGMFAVNEDSLNTGTVNPDPVNCSSGQYRGEDFKIVRVKVTWGDQFGSHSIERNAYITKH